MNASDAPNRPEPAASVVPDGIRQLLEQRQTYEEWLSRLDDVGGQYRTEVAERVRRDYESRLGGVARELEGHRADLEAALEARRDRLGDLAEGFERRSAELEEAELRFQVGEFDEPAWAEQREELTTGLEDIEEELDGARRAVEELEGVLGRLGGAPDHAVPAAGVPIPPDTGETTPPDEADEKADDVPSDVVPLRPEAGAVEQEAAEDEAVEGDAPEESTEPEEETADVAAVAAAPERTGKGESDDYLDELEFLESLSLDDPDTFDAVSRMLDDEEDR